MGQRFTLAGREPPARALTHTGGRRIEAAQALGIGRNTITRKIADLGIEGGKDTAAE